MDENVNIFPNPNNGSFTIDLENTENAVVKIYIISGQLILQKILAENTTKIDLTKHSKGMYLVKIETDSKTMVKKVIYQ
jgi:hypothetical protein